MTSARDKAPAEKCGRINFRASAREERLIRLGAAKRGEKLSRFIVESACDAAEMALAEEKHFALAPAEFARFAAALDRPAQVIPALQRLLSEESVLERPARQRTPVRRRTTGV